MNLEDRSIPTTADLKALSSWGVGFFVSLISTSEESSMQIGFSQTQGEFYIVRDGETKEVEASLALTTYQHALKSTHRVGTTISGVWIGNDAVPFHQLLQLSPLLKFGSPFDQVRHVTHRGGDHWVGWSMQGGEILRMGEDTAKELLRLLR